ncbi:hypothetical protein OEZ85_004815 [Tetradesmus obliquus]|uniref:Importin N-terminal domain-containing protein n=1 Tax=Tetradesmus obliquus TaxID=3088 RepID=A0ABY8UGB0_TETOB|nr:hypothetical protein OEZ85_004815 [Tetradesmus obliquus]
MSNNTPLSEADIPQLLQLLQGALSPDAPTQKQAEAVLASIEGRIGYCSCLAAVIGSKDADHSARWLAAVQLKNSVNKYWRPRYDSGGLTAEERAYLRGRFLQLIPQDDNQIAVQVALVVAKIAVQVALVVAKVARFDFPSQWPSLFSDLLAGLEPNAAAAAAAAAGGGGSAAGPSLLLVRRTYFVLHHVLKELSSKRLVADQKAFAEVTKLLFDHVWSSWCSLLGDILGALPAALAAPGALAPPQLLLAFERWLLLLKILRRLLLHGFQPDAKSLQPVQAVLLVAPQLLQAVAALQAARPGSSEGGSSSSSSSGSVGRSQLAAMVERGLLKLLKTLSQVQQEHPWSFHAAGVLLPTLEACYSLLLAAAAAGGGPFPAAREALLSAACGCVRGVLGCDGYAGRAGSGMGSAAERAAAIKPMAAEVSSQLSAWWGFPAQLPPLPALVAAGIVSPQQQQQQAHTRQAVLLQVLIAGYFVLNHRDLEEWSDDPEPWAHANADTAAHSEGLRSCCHQLALSLLLADKAALAPVLVQLLQQVSQVVPAGWGMGAPPAQQQQQQQQQGWQPLPGPAVHGTGGVQYPAVLLLKEAVYEAPAAQQQAAGSSGSSSSSGVDVVLQLAAVAALRALVDDFGFEGEAFVAVLPAVLGALCGMLQESEELDTQTQVFGLMNLIIERLGQDVIAPHVGGILPLLPRIWEAAADQSLLRIQVLCCASLLVNVLGEGSAATYGLLLPLLQQSLHPNSPQPELLEDALCLWLVALRNAPGGLGAAEGGGPAGALLQLAPALAACLTNSTEHISLGMQLLSSLIMLGGPSFLTAYGQQLLGACAAYVGEVVERGMLLLLPPIDLLLVAAPQQAAPLVLPFMQRLLGLRLAGSESAVVVANSLALFARLLLQHPAAFEQLLGNAAAAGIRAADPQQQQQQGGGSSPEALLLGLVSVWCEAFDSIAQPLARKLAACGLAALLGLPVKALLQQLPLLLSNISSVWLELEASGADDPCSDRGELLYGGGLWSGSSSSSAWEDGGYDDSSLGLSLVASEEASGEAERRQALREAEPLRHMRLSRLLADKLAAAAALHGGELAAAMAALDPAIGQQVQAVLAAAGQQQQR